MRFNRFCECFNYYFVPPWNFLPLRYYVSSSVTLFPFSTEGLRTSERAIPCPTFIPCRRSVRLGQSCFLTHATATKNHIRALSLASRTLPLLLAFLNYYACVQPKLSHELKVIRSMSEKELTFFHRTHTRLSREWRLTLTWPVNALQVANAIFIQHSSTN